MTKAIFLDIDGTLVSFDTHQIPASALAALSAAKKNGVKLFIATGRPRTMINNIGELERLGILDGYVTMNGSFCQMGEKTLYKKPIDMEEVRVIVDFCQEVGASCVVIREGSHWIYQSNAIFTEIFYDNLHVAPFGCITYEDIFTEPVFQLSPFITTEQESVILPQIGGCEIGRWFPAFSDIGASGNTKAKGIDVICGALGIEPESTMCFGDGGNDVSMLRHAGVGVAMGNASLEVQAEADYVTSSVDEDGIKRALEHFGVI